MNTPSVKRQGKRQNLGMGLGPILERHNAFQWTLTLPLPLPLDVFIPLIEELLGSNPLTAIFCHQIQWIHRHFVVEKLECWHKSLSLLALQSKIHCVSRVVSGRSKWRRAPPSRSNCLHFHAVFVKILQNWFLPQTQGLATTVWEILDPPLANTNIKRQTHILEMNTDDNTSSCFPNNILFTCSRQGYVTT